MLEVLKRFEHGTELGRTEIPVETVRKAFEVDVGGIHVSEELDPWLWRLTATVLMPRSRQACATSTAYRWTRMLRSAELSSVTVLSSLCRFCQDCIITTPGYDFRERQVNGIPPTVRPVLSVRSLVTIPRWRRSARTR